MLGRGGDFRQRQAAVTPGHHVAGAGDVDLGLVVFALDGARLVHLEQFRVQRPSVKLKDQLGDFRSSSKHDSSFFPLLPCDAVPPGRSDSHPRCARHLRDHEHNVYYSHSRQLGQRPLARRKLRRGNSALTNILVVPPPMLA